MATMIPYTAGENTASGAERKLFNLIKDDDRTRDWVVFHSLHLEHHVSQLEGEADFVILAPNLGCFVIEVKGGGVSFRTGNGLQSIPTALNLTSTILSSRQIWRLIQLWIS